MSYWFYQVEKMGIKDPAGLLKADFQQVRQGFKSRPRTSSSSRPCRICLRCFYASHRHLAAPSPENTKTGTTQSWWWSHTRFPNTAVILITPHGNKQEVVLTNPGKPKKKTTHNEMKHQKKNEAVYIYENLKYEIIHFPSPESFCKALWEPQSGRTGALHRSSS